MIKIKKKKNSWWCNLFLNLKLKFSLNLPLILSQIPSYIGALMHMMHVRVQKKNVRHLALMCYMWYMVIMSFILVLMYENFYVKLQR